MKRVKWVDDAGYVRCALLRDQDDESHPEVGIPVEPPPIERIMMESAKDVRNALVETGIITYRDLVESQNGVSLALNILRKNIIEAYRLKELENNGQY